MNVLWIVNNVMSFPAREILNRNNVYGGWLESALELIKFKCDNIIIVTINNVESNHMEKCSDENVTYYLIPSKVKNEYGSRLNMYWDIILNEFKPDIVHIHGAEYSLGLSFIENYTEYNNSIILSIQGIIADCSRVYFGKLKRSKILSCYTIHDCIKNSLFAQKKSFERKAAIEDKYMRIIHNVAGRTFYDKKFCQQYKSTYYHIGEALRAPFYAPPNWHYKNIQPFSIYISQANYPLKGFHVFLSALNIVREMIPNVQVYIGGIKMDKVSWLKKNSYQNLLSKLIQRYGLQQSVHFVGQQNAEAVKKHLLRAHIFVLPSFIENSSNSLGEAMITGTPSIASNVGGNAELLPITDQLYDPEDYITLSEKILKFFTKSGESLNYISEAQRKIANYRYDEDKIRDEYISTYEQIIKSQK